MDEVKSQSEDVIQIGNEKFIPYLKENEIQKRVKELGRQISNDFKNKLPIFIGVLNPGSGSGSSAK